jgi:hypothetical protein
VAEPVNLYVVERAKLERVAAYLRSLPTGRESDREVTLALAYMFQDLADLAILKDGVPRSVELAADAMLRAANLNRNG